MKREPLFRLACAVMAAAAIGVAAHKPAEAKFFQERNSTSDPRSCIKIEQQQSADGWWLGKFTNDASCPRVMIVYNQCRRTLGPPPTKYCQNTSRVLRTSAEKRINNYQDKVELLKACADKLCN
jgi:hypothetical protein